MEPQPGAHQRIQHKLFAGLLDAGSSSIATFLVGIIAIRNLSLEDLGIYGTLFSAFLFGGLVSSEAFFLPRSLTSLQKPASSRLEGLGSAVVGSWRHGLAGCLAVVIALVVVADQGTSRLLIPEALGTLGLVFVSPMQDYVRRSFHLAERSWLATVVSGVQLISVIAIESVARWAGISVVMFPLIILLLANCLSLITGLALAGRGAFKGDPTPDPAISTRAAVSSALLIYGASFVCSLLMARIAGTASVGYAEAARTAAQPVLVVGMGLSAAFSSRALGATLAGNRSAVWKVNGTFVGLLALATAGYAVPLFSGPTRDVLTGFVPAAYAVEGLLVATLIANLASSSTFLVKDQLLNGGLGGPMVRIDFIAASLPVITGLASAQLLAFARPVGLIGQHLMRLILYRGLWAGLFRPGRKAQTSQPSG